MELWLLSLIQGLTEVLPISSTGHLALTRQFLNAEIYNLGLAAALHGASAAAIVLWFWRDITALVQRLRASVVIYLRTIFEGENPFNTPGENRVPYYMALSLVPLVIEALIFRNWAEAVFTDGRTVPFFLIGTGFVIFITARFTRGGRSLAELGWREYLFIGGLQGIAVLPGVSRLGMALCAGLWCKLSWREALRLAFLQAIPVIAGGVTIQLPEISALYSEDQIVTWLIAMIIVMISSWIGLKMVTSRVLERGGFIFFGYYCLLLGVFIVIFQSSW